MFAVVSDEPLAINRIVSCLRYIPTEQGLKKVSTNDANHYLKTNYPEYLYFSKQLDTVLHAIPLTEIQAHYQPVERLKQICNTPADNLETLASQLATYFISQGITAEVLGISGSILISAHGPTSDIDMVVYGRDNFFKVRNSLKHLIDKVQLDCKRIHQYPIHALSHEQWQKSWQRRGCDLSLQDYIWHEQRKFNKGIISGVKFDLSMVEQQTITHTMHQKQGSKTIMAHIIDDSKSYDFPAVYTIDHPQIGQIISYSATYAGQAILGELIEAKGIHEQSENGLCRLVVGSSREAGDEYLRVVHS